MCSRGARTNPIAMIHVRYCGLAAIYPQAFCLNIPTIRICRDPVRQPSSTYYSL